MLHAFIKSSLIALFLLFQLLLILALMIFLCTFPQYRPLRKDLQLRTILRKLHKTVVFCLLCFAFEVNLIIELNDRHFVLLEEFLYAVDFIDIFQSLLMLLTTLSVHSIVIC